ncbi:MAG: hypothetical protein MUD01_02895 [Chloroflexaceae bacterium]|nr:hypothetical protein [Chloroflexaceae bacterium]
MPLQIPQLDDRNFEQLVAEARARIPVHTPEWTNFNESDPGITLVQLFAFLTENLLYRSNRIPEANRTKFLTLLGMGLLPATPGQGLVVFRNERGPVQALPFDVGVEVRAGQVPFRTRTAVCVLPIESAVFYKKPQNLDEAQLAQYKLLYESFLGDEQSVSTGDLSFYKTMPLDAPEIGKPLPAVELADSLNGTLDRSLWVALVGQEGRAVSDVQAALAGQTLTLGIYPDPTCAARTLLPQSYAPQTVADPGLVFELLVPDAQAENQYMPAIYERLEISYAENVLDGPGIVQLQLPGYEKLSRFSYEKLNFDPVEDGTGDYPPLVEDKKLAARIVGWLRLRLPESVHSGQATEPAASNAAPAQQARLSWVGVNAARVIQALPVTNERLGVGTGTPDQRLRLANTPIIVEPAADGTSAPKPSLVLEIQDSNGNWQVWQPTDDLFAARPNDQVYQIDPESGVVQFGDGLRGKRPPLGAAMRASYEYGGGPAGAVAIKTINKSPALPAGYSVLNPLPTWGADAGEDVAAGERNIPRYIRHRDRLVTGEDFRDIARRTPGVEVGRVEVLPLFNPDAFVPGGPAANWPGTVTLLAIPRYDQGQPNAPQADRMFLNAICAWLDSRRLVTTEIYVRGAAYVPIWASVGVQFAPGRLRELVRQDIQSALRDYLSPLIGGPPVPGGVSDPCSPEATDPCAPAQGVGWPLGVEVRQQDLEATVTRVAGVRYVNGIRLAVRRPDGTLATDVERIAMEGLQLPYLVGVSVTEGNPEDPAALLGQSPAPGNKTFPVPVLPRKC